jgi:primosomal protein N' (replication factor Y)
VPLGPRRPIGCLLKETKRPPFATKEVLEILDEGEPLLSPVPLKLLSWGSAYYLTPIGEVLRHLVPRRLLQRKEGIAVRPTVGQETRFCSLPALTPRQAAAVAAILAEPDRPLLLHGVTGSGKTEVYIGAAQEVLKKGGQALVLVPEIGLTPQIVERFRRGLAPPASVAVSHSALTESERFQVWEKCRRGEVSLVIATRSGIFLPFANLRLIVVDEEHDPSYKQEERFCYHARDLALWRGEAEKIPVVLGSATPSLESLYRVEKGKMRLVTLPERPEGVNRPTLLAIDRRMRGKGERAHPLFSDELLEALRENLRKGEQSLLFINRRGFSPFVLCPSCGFVPRCGRCDISLTLHPPRLVCHYCDKMETFRPVCPQCRQGNLAPRGFGTERIEQEIRRLFPSARTGRMDRDAVRKREAILERMRRREIDILIGTQMITKGHDYPELTLVGILDADVALHLPDFRAAERTYQVITQVSGRAGRGAKPGRVLIQTSQPDHESLAAAAAQDGNGFYARELRQRLEAGYPPFKRLIEIRLSHKKRETVVQSCRLLLKKIQKTISSGEADLLGPAPCPIEKVRERLRWHLLIKTARYADIQPRLRRLLDDFAENDLPSKTKLLVNVDPVEMI